MSLSPTAEQANALAGLRVLVIEDEALISMLIADVLTDAGASVVDVAARVDEARASALSADIELAVIDMNLGGESGTPVAKILAERKIPFLIVSGYGARLPDGTPPAPVLSKPFETDALIKAVARIAGRTA